MSIIGGKGGDGSQSKQPQKSSHKKLRQRQLSAIDFYLGVGFDKGYIEPLRDDVHGIGDKFSPLYYVDTVTHTFTAVGYRQSFKLKRNTIGG